MSNTERKIIGVSRGGHFRCNDCVDFSDWDHAVWTVEDGVQPECEYCGLRYVESANDSEEVAVDTATGRVIYADERRTFAIGGTNADGSTRTVYRNVRPVDITQRVNELEMNGWRRIYITGEAF
ncbi:hypothetical protein PBI_GAIA_182 [Mycobacterium phage Gaia]|uniref:Uncharacterized protein n=1 Tax=Mycobacterium phage Gaia TaxID=1486472 RepID=A0A068F3R3_9CAUD|nr:hypothetical protein VC46_gp054 [Mycobacterium phage Gaia]AID58998.1 hypothetical protein PBI_GAIA_182 [Mycobacterium phage Gaia]AYR00106.1 hypothetical protein PBI_NEBKISS_177 [Mycobacterium phage Nebkiss]